jgi:hypothetical protein
MLLFAVLLSAAEIPASAASDAAPPVAKANSCPRTTRQYAWQRGKPLTPKKLTELPPGKGYMAVYRTVNGCEYPMTMVEYRTQGRSR